LPSWHGDRDPDAVTTDYDRACEISTAVSLTPVGDVDALVLGDDPVELEPDVSLTLIRLTRVADTPQH
jgi:hypothetical protein